MFSPRTRPHRQRGIVLLVSLALLTALAVGGLAAAQTTTLELRMARNQHDAALALHAAEVALSAAEAWLQANADPAGPATLFAAGGAGLHEAVGYDQVAPWRDASAWAGAQVLANVVPNASAQPRYLVEWLGTRIDAGSVTNPQPPVVIDTFRITARGAGNRAWATLQTTYGLPRGRGRRAITGRLSWLEVDSLGI